MPMWPKIRRSHSAAHIVASFVVICYDFSKPALKNGECAKTSQGLIEVWAEEEFDDQDNSSHTNMYFKFGLSQ